MVREIAERRDVIPVLGEIFREHGYAGASLSQITQRTGLGKGSLYHFFPKGKREMAEAVLDDVASWFETNIYAVLRSGQDPEHGIEHMFEGVNRYFRSGKRICLVGAFALDDTRDEFAAKVNAYFTEWIRSLASALERQGAAPDDARDTAEDVVAGVQGALVLARSRDDPEIFSRALLRFKRRIADTRNV